LIRLAATAFAAVVILGACNGGSSAPTPTPSPTPTPTPTSTPTPVPTPSPTPDGSSGPGSARFDPERAFAHVDALAVEIGSRPAGSEAEREAARYLRGQLSGFGYETELQPFSFDVFADAGSSLEVLTPQAMSPAVHPFESSADGVVEGQLVEAGIGEPGDFPPDTTGKIALIERGTLYHSDKVANAAAAGARAAVIFNNEPGLFRGSLSERSLIPALALSQEDGEDLLAMMQSGPVSVRLEVRTKSGPRDSQNVVARPPDGECRVVAGGHYDSVPAGPGANDNGSGSATVVEMARVLAADGEFDDVCFVLFGSEEVGLFGSAHFVGSLTLAESDTLEGMLNFDMVGVGRQWLLTGSLGLTDIAAAEAEERGLDYTVESSSTAVGSDHASFINADIPAVFLHSLFTFVADDPNYHTATDQAQHVQPTRMAEIAEAGLAVIDVLLSGR
jgi:aminopeptidase YwaD